MWQRLLEGEGSQEHWEESLSSWNALRRSQHRYMQPGKLRNSMKRGREGYGSRRLGLGLWEDDDSARGHEVKHVGLESLEVGQGETTHANKVKVGRDYRSRNGVEGLSISQWS